MAPTQNPGPFEVVSGVYHDGQSAADAAVLVRVEGDELIIADADGLTLARWALKDLTLAGGSVVAGELRLHRGDADPDRLTLSDQAFIEALVARLPHLREERIFDFVRLRLVFGLVAVMAGVLAVLFYGVVPLSSEYLAQNMPAAWERRIGEDVKTAIIADFARAAGRRPEDLLCEGQVGSEALATLVGRIEPHARSDFPLDVVVLDLDAVNAFAMPGGNIILFKGLLNFARSGDEVAGVVAHEAAHVEYHHPSRKIFESGSTNVLLSLLFGDFGGRDLALAVGNLLLSAGYSREMEWEADHAAVRMLGDAQIPSEPLAGFLDRVQRASGPSNEDFEWMMTHPSSRRRALSVREAGAVLTDPRPALTDAEFLRLRLICSDQDRAPDQRLPLKTRSEQKR